MTNKGFGDKNLRKFKNLRKRDGSENLDMEVRKEVPIRAQESTDTSENSYEIIRAIALSHKYLTEHSSQQNKEVVDILNASQQEIKFLNEQLVKRDEQHNAEVKELKTKIQELVEDMEVRRKRTQRIEEEQISRSQKKKNRKRRPLKDPISQEDLLNLLSYVKTFHAGKDPLIIARYRVAIIILYLFGIRVNELRQITLYQIQQYLKGSNLSVAIGKSRIRSKIHYPSSKESRDFLTRHGKDDLALLEANNTELLLPISREHLTRELNTLFRTYGQTVHKTYLTHSCRVSFITRICKTSGIEAARAMVGHSSISTTQIYNRNYLNPREQKRLLNASLQCSDVDTAENTELDNLLQEDM